MTSQEAIRAVWNVGFACLYESYSNANCSIERCQGGGVNGRNVLKLDHYPELTQEHLSKDRAN